MRRHRNPIDPMNCNHRGLRGKLNSSSNNLSFCKLHRTLFINIHQYIVHYLATNTHHREQAESHNSMLNDLSQEWYPLSFTYKNWFCLVCFFLFAKTPTGRFGLLLPRHVRNLACFIVRPQGEFSLEREIVCRPLCVIFFGLDSWLGVATPCLQPSIKRAIQMIEWSHDYVFQRIQCQPSPPCCSQHICTEIYVPS